MCGVHKLLERCVGESLLRWYGPVGYVANEIYDSLAEGMRREEEDPK